jgi:pyridoxine kinase
MTRPLDAVLSIQSAVAYGHVGNSAAVLPLQRQGFDVFPVNTVLLAHHPGHGRGWRGHKVTPSQIDEILTGLEDHGALRRCAAVLSGYLGDPAVADCVLRAVSHTKAARPDALYLCDPVIGDDHSGVFVAAGIPEAIRDRLLPAADIVTPNRFELAHLSGRTVNSLEETLAAAADLRACGPRLVVATGLTLPDRPEDVAVLADSASETWLVTTPRRPVQLGGTGDAFSALFLGQYLATADLRLALERSVAAIYTLVERTHASGADELCLVAAQDELLAPDHHYLAVQLRRTGSYQLTAGADQNTGRDAAT